MGDSELGFYWPDEETVEVLDMDIANTYWELMADLDEEETQDSDPAQVTLMDNLGRTGIMDTRRLDITWDFVESRDPNGHFVFTWVPRQSQNDYVVGIASSYEMTTLPQDDPTSTQSIPPGVNVEAMSVQLSTVSSSPSISAASAISSVSLHPGVKVDVGATTSHDISTDSVFGMAQNPEVNSPHEQFKVEMKEDTGLDSNEGMDTLGSGVDVQEVPPRGKNLLLGKRRLSLECHHCKMLFQIPYELKRHVLIHEGDSLHYCDVCGVPYRCLTTLSKHIYRVHGRAPPKRPRYVSNRGGNKLEQ